MAGFPAGYNLVPDGVGGMTLQSIYPYPQMQPGYNQVSYNNMIQNQAQAFQGAPQQSIMQQPLTQQVAQQMPPMMVPGKIVDSVDFVKVADIPMDSKTYYFPKGDGMEIYTKRWRDDGNTEIVTYVRQKEQPTEETKNVLESMFVSKEDLQGIQEAYVSLEQKMNSVMDIVTRLEQAFK